MNEDRAVQRCPRCLATFYVLADEAGMHECPRCGYWPGEEEDDDDLDPVLV